jgi:hypothetical protein
MGIEPPPFAIGVRFIGHFGGLAGGPPFVELERAFGRGGYSPERRLPGKGLPVMAQAEGSGFRTGAPGSTRPLTDMRFQSAKQPVEQEPFRHSERIGDGQS